MVLFSNINIGQKIQVYFRGTIQSGIVKYKGGLANIQGDWVGVEFDEPVGKHNGSYKGRQYFACRPKHGVFVHSSSVKFDYLKRWYFDTYRTANPTSSTDETLFYKSKPRSPEPCDPMIVPEKYSFATRKDDFCDVPSSWHAGMSSKPRSKSLYLGSPSPMFHRKHSIGQTFKAREEEERPQTAMGIETFRSLTGHTVRSSTFRMRRSLDLDPGSSINRSFSPEIGSPTQLRTSLGRSDICYATSPSMPKIHMPIEALQVQNGKGWNNAHKPREWTL